MDQEPKPDENNKPKKKRLRKMRPRKAVNHELAARWIQEQILDQIPEIGYVSDKLIERVLRLEHRYYAEKGYKQIKFTDKKEK